ncbi:MAG: hypothetical protein IKT41_04985 [Clostridia bacterium]|nr:hypothetical protein [Clostridia bacterium]
MQSKILIPRKGNEGKFSPSIIVDETSEYVILRGNKTTAKELGLTDYCIA